MDPLLQMRLSKSLAALKRGSMIAKQKLFSFPLVRVKEYPIIVFEIINIDGEECQNWGEHEDQIDFFKFVNIPIRKKVLE